MRRPPQLVLPLHRGRWGGWRPDAGRKAGPNPRVRHRRRRGVAKDFPCHVTLKVREGLPSLRTLRVVREVEETFRKGKERPGFRLLQYSIQGDHLHAIVEADGAEALGRGMKSLAARFARAVNRALRRSGRVLGDHYHLHVLETPREVRNALAYVLLNARKHLAERLRKAGRRIGATPLDPASSARWFRGWREGSVPVQTEAAEAAAGPPAVAEPCTWLLRSGWRAHRLIDPLEVPGRGRSRKRRSG
jgi:REP-associated tyrosine transposase